MSRALLAIALIFVAAGLARAQSPEPPAIVKTRCAACHGERGESAGEDFPRLAAQHEAYLAKQLADFKAGRREGIMQRMVRGVAEGDLEAAARYYSAQSVPAPAPKSELHDVGRFVFLRGNPWAKIPACKACHGESAHGSAQLPRLATQNAAYLERQIREFTQRKRTNDNEVMHSIAERLTALEARAVAEYLATLP
ncbi:MAG: c-type cytochrome [Burkholderiales bacterium]|nr:c-type cytochrome [Burkholderiales bacterium]